MSVTDTFFRMFEFWRRRPRLRVEAEVKPERVANTGWTGDALYRPRLRLRVTNLSSEIVVVPYLRGEGEDLHASYEMREPLKLAPRDLAKVEFDVGLPNPEFPLSLVDDAWLEDTTGVKHKLPNIGDLKERLEGANATIEGWARHTQADTRSRQRVPAEPPRVRTRTGRGRQTLPHN